MVAARTGSELREGRRRRMVDEIEACALNLFTERSFDSVSLDEIADSAGISKRTLFRYFPNKSDLVLHGLRQHIDLLGRALATRPPRESALEALRGAFLEMAGSYESERETMRARFRILDQVPSLRAQSFGEMSSLLDSISAVIATKLDLDPVSDIRPLLVATATISTVLAALQLWLDEDCDDLTGLIGRAIDLLVGGFAVFEDACQPAD